MEPLRKALRLPRVNLFIADDTGLGKTIEAGLIARELLLRKKAKTIVVATPPSVLEQWKAEFEERFGLVFELLWAAIALSVSLNIALIYMPFLQQAFSTPALSAADWLVCMAVASSVLWLRELSKAATRAT